MFGCHYQESCAPACRDETRTDKIAAKQRYGFMEKLSIDTIILLNQVMPVTFDKCVICQTQHFIFCFKIPLKPSALYF